MKNVRSKIQPQLIRKRTIIPVPKNIVVVIEPSKAHAKTLKDIASAKSIKDLARPDKTVPQQIRPAVVQRARSGINVAPAQQVSRQGAKHKFKRSKIIYQSREPSPDSLAKIHKIKSIGNKKALVIIGNGPSINEVDVTKITNHEKIHTLSINKPDPRLWPTNYWAFFDSSQFKRHKNLWDEYNGIIFNSTAIKQQKEHSIQFKNIGGKGFSLEATKGIHIGRSSVYASMQIALWMDYSEIFIFGCDMNPNGINGRLHFYGDNPDVNPAVRKNRFKNEAEYYDWIVDNVDELLRKRFYFCTDYNPWSFMGHFNQMSHKTAIEHILNKYS